MSSSDPDELRAELEAIDFTGDEELLTEFRSEARETVAAQRDTLNDIDTKASKLLRLNVLLIGVVASLLSIATRDAPGSGLDQFMNLYMTLAVTALVLSTALAAITYTASELDVGVSSDNLQSLLREAPSSATARELLVKNAVVRINFNRSTNIRNVSLITSTLVLVVASVVFFVLSAYEAVVGSVPVWLLALCLGLLLAVVWASGLVTQVWRAVHDVREWR